MKFAALMIYMMVGFGVATGAGICRPSYYEGAGLVRAAAIIAGWPPLVGLSIMTPACPS